MKSLTIHNLETDTGQAIEQLAKQTGLSQNKVIKKLLRKALGLEVAKTNRSDFSSFCGLWSDEEAESFDKAIQALGEIEADLWQ